ncbi:hypothetical protein J3R83DRAFT_13808 [Lanmaoa asiatica]|nr:hypothetical protein J3R83DRAFT_13808 [Lanmaoa asiatica]
MGMGYRAVDKRLQAFSASHFASMKPTRLCTTSGRKVVPDWANNLDARSDVRLYVRVSRDMTKHSKNNTASSVFSYAEKQKTEYGTKHQRLGNESMRNFDACALCLQRARDPIACDHGHLFCKECAYADLLSQKKDIKRQKVRLEQLKREAEEEKQRALEAARERVLRDFEKGQLGLSANLPAIPIPTSGTEPTKESHAGKRKLDFDSSTVEMLAREAEEAALRLIEREQAEALRHKLPDFWLPSLTPTYTSNGPPLSLKDVKPQTMCRGGSPPHAINLKSFIPVQFSFLASSSAHSTDSTPTTSEVKKLGEPKDPICPSCKTSLSNNKILFSRVVTGVISFYCIETNESWTLLTQEFTDDKYLYSRYYTQEFRTSSFMAEFSFTSDPTEQFYGVGQHACCKDNSVNKKGQSIDLIDFDSFVPLPVYMSNKGYLQFFNMPSQGQIAFSPIRTQFVSSEAAVIDYYITTAQPGDYDTLQQQYTGVTGRQPTPPDFALGYQQSKLRYWNQTQFMDLAQRFHDEQVNVSLIVVDFFNWKCQGDWSFDLEYWPDPALMAQAVKNLTGAEMMASL